MGKKWWIGDISFQTKEEYKAGQRDLKQVQKLTAGLDINDPAQADELYQTLKKQPFLFETEVGIAFRSYLLDKSEGVKNSGSPFPKGILEKNSRIAASHKDRPRPEKKKSGKNEEVVLRKSDDFADKSSGRKKILIGTGAFVSIAVMLFALYQIFSYDIWSYISEKKMKELAAEVLVPVEAQVSEEHRIADLIASGLYTPEEAEIKVKEELAATENKTEEGSDILYKYSVLYGRNADMAGWIQVEGTVINYPVMQTPDDEEYYLKKGFDKKYDINGIPFMDARCSITEPTANFLIYGHNMKNGSMFSALLQYEKRDFYEEHSLIRFDTVYETGLYEIVGVFRTRVAYRGEDVYRYYEFIDAEDAEAFDEYIRFVKEQSFYETGVTAEYGDQLLTLSTCDRSIEDGRLVVVGRKCSENR